MPTERRPNFFIVGAQKSGTSSLAAQLGLHPQVFMSFPKEPGYLAFGDSGYVFLDGYGRQGPSGSYVVTNEHRYLGLFAGAAENQPVLAEASTWYFSLPGMARKLKQYNPEARVLVVLRNPVDRAYSAWCHARRDNLEPCEDFGHALELEDQRGDAEFLLRYRYMGNYSGPLAEYQAEFDPSQLLVLLYEDLHDDVEELRHHLCDFLQIDSSLMPQHQRHLNRSGMPRFRLLQRVLGSYRTRVIVRKMLPNTVSVLIKEKLDGLNLKRFPGPNAHVRSQLQEYYREDIEQLAVMTGRNLDSWLS